MPDNILKKLGIKPKRFTTEELKEILLRKPGELTGEGNVITPEDYRMALTIPGKRELMMKQYFDEAFKECIEDVRYNTSVVSTECICKKIRDEKFRDAVRHPEKYISPEAITKFPKKK